MLAALVLCAVFSALAPQEDEELGEGTIAEPGLDLRVEPFADYFFAVRRWAGEGGGPSVEYGAAVEAARELQRCLQSPLEWGAIEGLLGECATAADAVRIFETLPEKRATRDGHAQLLRAPALRLARELAESEANFRAFRWPDRSAELESARETIRKQLGAGRCLEALQRDLQLTLPIEVPVVLVLEMPPPGAVTHRGPDGKGICFVSVRGAKGTQLLETVLHESTHAFDLASEDDVLDRLRARLEQAGVDRKDRLWRDVPHTLMFVEAGEVVRRVVDPEHVHYGETAGVYTRTGEIAVTVRSAWTAHLDGEIDLDQTLDRIVAAVKAQPPPR